MELYIHSAIHFRGVHWDSFSYNLVCRYDWFISSPKLPFRFWGPVRLPAVDTGVCFSGKRRSGREAGHCRVRLRSLPSLRFTIIYHFERLLRFIKSRAVGNCTAFRNIHWVMQEKTLFMHELVSWVSGAKEANKCRWVRRPTCLRGAARHTACKR